MKNRIYTIARLNLLCSNKVPSRTRDDCVSKPKSWNFFFVSHVRDWKRVVDERFERVHGLRARTKEKNNEKWKMLMHLSCSNVVCVGSRMKNGAVCIRHPSKKYENNVRWKSVQQLLSHCFDLVCDPSSFSARNETVPTSHRAQPKGPKASEIFRSKADIARK